MAPSLFLPSLLEQAPPRKGLRIIGGEVSPRLRTGKRILGSWGRVLLRLGALLHPNLLQQAQVILSDLVVGIEAEGSPQMGLRGGVILLRGQDRAQARFSIGIVGPALYDLLKLAGGFGELASEGQRRGQVIAGIEIVGIGLDGLLQAQHGILLASYLQQGRSEAVEGGSASGALGNGTLKAGNRVSRLLAREQ